MNKQTKHPSTESPNLQSPNLSMSKESWTEPVLRVTPIDETAGNKATAIGDGTDAFSS